MYVIVTTNTLFNFIYTVHTGNCAFQWAFAHTNTGNST